LDLKEGFTLFYSGKIVPRKGLIEIINIFNILGKKYDVNLLMVGSGDQKYLEFLKKGIKNGLKDRVRIVPFIPHKRLPMYMSIGHLGCWLGSIPSASINEFLSVGRPILVKIFEGRNLERLGYSFAKKHMNLKNSLRWIQSLIEDTALYKEQCNQARNYALNHLDWKITTKQIIHLYNS
ncbi:MAG: glycosyltransferase, partial [Candidatus Hodarchaeota archaeon]